MIVILIITLLTGCSSNKIKVGKPAFKDTTSDGLNTELGLLIVDFTSNAIDWYNIYQGYPLNKKEEESLKVIMEDLDDLTTEIILNTGSLTEEIAAEIKTECLYIYKAIASRTRLDREIGEEKRIREVNLKQLSDNELKELEDNRPVQIIEIKELLEKMINNHYK